MTVLKDRQRAEEAIRTLLLCFGEDPNREGLQKTPERVVRAFEEYLKGYGQDPLAHLDTFFSDVSGYDQPVILKDIPFYSLCEHHLAPMHGFATIAYWPEKRVVGISKLARVVDVYARRLQIQERMTSDIAECLQMTLQPRGVAVMIKAVHHCMFGRGVSTHSTELVTFHFTGLYKTDSSLQRDFKNSL